jgi:hypothetical protein
VEKPRFFWRFPRDRIFFAKRPVAFHPTLSMLAARYQEQDSNSSFCNTLPSRQGKVRQESPCGSIAGKLGHTAGNDIAKVCWPPGVREIGLIRYQSKLAFESGTAKSGAENVDEILGESES